MTGFVYAMVCGDGRVKIGYTNNPRRRLYEVRCSSGLDVNVVGLIPGDRALEKALHGKFLPWHLQGEWFRLEADVAAFVSGLPRPKPFIRKHQVGRGAMHCVRIALNFSQKEMADTAGVDQATVSRWEHGFWEPKLSQMKRIRAVAQQKIPGWRDEYFFVSMRKRGAAA